MKKLLFLLAIAAIAVGCEVVDYQGLEPGFDETVGGSQLIMKVSSGYSSDQALEDAPIYVEQDVMTGISIASKTESNPLLSASWTIEGKTYDGLSIGHKFSSLGKIAISISAHFADDKVETRVFTIEVVKDLSQAGPIFLTSRKNGSSYDVFVGWERRWLKNYAGDPWSIIGDPTSWQKVSLNQPYYNVGDNWNPIASTDPASKYVGAWVNIREIGSLNKIALVDWKGNWVNIGGSPYAMKDDPGLVYFVVFKDGTIGSSGDGGDVIEPEELPGSNGDSYFRYDEVADRDGKVSIYFLLDNDWTNKSFVVREIIGGEYGDPVLLSSVANFTNWGQIKTTKAGLLEVVSGWRYGEDVSKPSEYSFNMKRSSYYDQPSNSLRLQLVGLQAIKKK
ncbi:MAG: hypothetical protein ACOX0C_02635 [Patescibacteria group bacterium]|jgi:hypothetical protein